MDEQRGFGDLRLQSNPAGVAVYVDNNYAGTTISSTALYVTQLKQGSYTVRVTLAGYQINSQTAAITAGKSYDYPGKHDSCFARPDSLHKWSDHGQVKPVRSQHLP
jgi:hypothetical protein